MSDVRVGDIGTVITFNTATDISALTAARLLYRKPDGTKGEWAATLSGTDSVEYTVIAGDIDMVGSWELQAAVEFATGQWYSVTDTMSVGKNLEA